MQRGDRAGSGRVREEVVVVDEWDDGGGDDLAGEPPAVQRVSGHLTYLLSVAEAESTPASNMLARRKHCVAIGGPVMAAALSAMENAKEGNWRSLPSLAVVQVECVVALRRRGT